jgi:5-formyltetrahydrofolate cyclo-ligase
VNAKANLRKYLRIARQDFVKQRNSLKWPVSERAVSNFRTCLKAQNCIAAYCSVGDEVDPSSLIRIGRDAGLTIALPCADTRQARIVFRAWGEDEALERSPLGFSQPRADALIVSPSVILTPLVGFDRALNRLGQGASHYDRAFADHPKALRIGVAWSVQEVSAIPVDPWDVPLDAVITENEWIAGPDSRVHEGRVHEGRVHEGRIHEG